MTDNPYRVVWKEVIDQFIDQASLEEELRRALPHEGIFEDLGHLEYTLDKSGLKDIQSTTRTYEQSQTVAEFVEIRSCMIPSRIIASRLGKDVWRHLLDQIVDRLSHEFMEPFTYSNKVNMASGLKP